VRRPPGAWPPVCPPSQPGSFPGQDTRWQLLSRCLDDTTTPLDVRPAGTMLLLYGQSVTRVVRLTTDDLRYDGHAIYLQAGAVPVLLPPGPPR
jgi:hypothetical protein